MSDQSSQQVYRFDDPTKGVRPHYVDPRPEKRPYGVRYRMYSAHRDDYSKCGQSVFNCWKSDHTRWEVTELPIEDTPLNDYPEEEELRLEA